MTCSPFQAISTRFSFHIFEINVSSHQLDSIAVSLFMNINKHKFLTFCSSHFVRWVFICGIYLSLYYYDFSKFCKANIKRVCGVLVGGLPASALDRDTWQPSTTSNPKHLKPRFFLSLVFVSFDSYLFLLWNGPK